MNYISTASQRLADGIIHVVGIVAGVLGVTAMLIAATWLLPAASTASLCIYGAAMLGMLGFSAAYHMTPAAGWKDFLRRLDHAAIFLKIAGTYTPFAVIKVGGAAGYALLGSVWTVALLGAAGKLLLPSTWDRVAVPLYLALRWAGLVMFKPLAVAVPPTAMVLLGAGGAVYSIGVIFHLWRTLPYQNAAWHLCVLAGTACHFGAVTTATFA